MRVLKRILIGLLFLIVVMIGLAYLMPNHYGVIRSIHINTSPDKIYPLIAAPKEWKKWSIWNQRDPQMEMLYAGPETGAGASWDWKSKSQGNGGMKFTRVAPNQVINYELHFEGMGKPSNGALTLEPEGASTKVTWSMVGSSEGNFMMKLFAPFMDKMVGPDFEDGLKNLKTVAEKQP
ncbi:SRPBCC family protein [Undibacterium flavidum]|uniref:SRPBCC family protein n=1 Tax=Undibacterium flavidum TaxID=2762297 RepID=A0ABR6YAE5_9BURK|nr:SRPBCC family protein [Undibacterium flavidum]MBC3873525.1 SRPBCC family protein [Undibacterium flavidum]